MPFLSQYKNKKQDKKSFNAAKTAPSNSERASAKEEEGIGWFGDLMTSKPTIFDSL